MDNAVSFEKNEIALTENDATVVDLADAEPRSCLRKKGLRLVQSNDRGRCVPSAARLMSVSAIRPEWQSLFER